MYLTAAETSRHGVILPCSILLCSKAICHALLPFFPDLRSRSTHHENCSESTPVTRWKTSVIVPAHAPGPPRLAARMCSRQTHRDLLQRMFRDPRVLEADERMNLIAQLRERVELAPASRGNSCAAGHGALRRSAGAGSAGATARGSRAGARLLHRPASNMANSSCACASATRRRRNPPGRAARRRTPRNPSWRAGRPPPSAPCCEKASSAADTAASCRAHFVSRRRNNQRSEARTCSCRYQVGRGCPQACNSPC